MAIINPATIKAATTMFTPQVTRAVAFRLASLFRGYNPATMGLAFANNPKLASAMNQMLPKLRQLTASLQKSESFRQLCAAAWNYTIDKGIPNIGNPSKKTAFQKTLFPPGVHSLARESYSGNTSSISAMVGQEQWHALLLGGENRRVTQTEWKPDAHGHLTCKTWEPGQQKTWNWIQNKAGDKIAMDDGKTLEDGSRVRMAFFYPAGGGPVVHKHVQTDANGKTTFMDPQSGAARPRDAASASNKHEATGPIVEEVDDEPETVSKPVKQIEPAPTSSSALVRRTPGGKPG